MVAVNHLGFFSLSQLFRSQWRNFIKILHNEFLSTPRCVSAKIVQVHQLIWLPDGLLRNWNSPLLNTVTISLLQLLCEHFVLINPWWPSCACLKFGSSSSSNKVAVSQLEFFPSLHLLLNQWRNFFKTLDMHSSQHLMFLSDNISSPLTNIATRRPS